MGNEVSTLPHQGGVTAAGVRVGAHTSMPVDSVPYAGSQRQYTFIDVEALMTTQATFFSAPVVTTNVDAYYSVISQPYAQGFAMNQFQAIPGVQRQKGFSFSVGMPFQAILSKSLGPPTHERWQLRIEKSFLQTQQVLKFFTTTSQVVSDTSDIYQKVNAVAAQGGRLICIEITGYEQGPNFSQAFSGYQGVKGVDLFFNMPLHPNPTIYSYQAVTVPIHFRTIAAFPQPRIQVLTDFLSQFTSYLQKGWKLVEINFDCSQTTQPDFFQSRSSMNSIWFFEKESHKINSQVPEWEGTIVEYEHKVSQTFSGTKARTNWNPIVTEMGRRGWELACLVESPETRVQGFSSIIMKVMMFFQRPIVRPASAGGFVMPTQTGYPAPPPGAPAAQTTYPMGSNPPPQPSYALGSQPPPQTHPQAYPNPYTQPSYPTAAPYPQPQANAPSFHPGYQGNPPAYPQPPPTGPPPPYTAAVSQPSKPVYPHPR